MWLFTVPCSAVVKVGFKRWRSSYIRLNFLTKILMTSSLLVVIICSVFNALAPLPVSHGALELTSGKIHVVEYVQYSVCDNKLSYEIDLD